MRREVPGTKFETISSPTRCLGLLRRFKEQMAALTVTLPGAPDEYLSSILDIDSAGRAVILDELKPQEGHERLLQAGRCNVSLHLRGQGLHFTSELLSHACADGIAYYRLALPHRMRHYSQRGAHRVPVPVLYNLPVVIRDQAEVLRGEVIDMSMSGIGFTVPRCAWSDALEPGHVIPLLSLQRDGDDPIDVTVEVRHTAFGKDRSEVRIGACYADLERQQRKTLERFVVELERYRLRNMVRV